MLFKQLHNRTSIRCKARLGSKCTVKAAQNGHPPSSAREVVSWAQQQFLQEVSRDKHDCNINLAKVCMLLALEEEAASQLDSPPSTSTRTSATASTWSLERLDALAAEVVDTLTALEDSPHTPPPPAAAAANTINKAFSSDTADGSSSSAEPSGQQQQQEQSRPQQDSSVRAAFAAVRQQAQQYPMQVLNALNHVLFRRHGYSACNRFGASVDSQLSAVLEDGPGSVAALTILYLEVCARLGLDCGVKVVEDGRYCLVWPTPHTRQQQTQQQQQQQDTAPPQLEVGQQQEGLQPGEQQQNQQQPEGMLPPTQQQQQPLQTLLSVGGDACVVDVYGEGALLPVREATELFGITAEELLSGSTRRELLASLLSELQTAHWCAAVGCSATPALMTPLTAGTAVRQAVRQLHGGSIERAAAAATKRVVLLPQEPAAQLDLALLSYFSGRYDDAWLELGSYLEQLKAAAQREQQQEGGEAEASGASSSQGVASNSSSSGPQGASNSSSSSSSSSGVARVTELHAAIQSMLIGGAVVPEVPSAPAAPTAAEAALASADEEGPDSSRASRREDQELDDIVLLFHKLQLELMVAANQQA